MNLREYERRRNALEVKWIPKIRKQLNRIIALYIEQYLKGNQSTDFIQYHYFYEILSKLYVDAGSRMAGVQYRELRGQLPKRLSHKQDLVKNKTDVSTSGLSTKNQFTDDVIRQLQIAGLNLAQKISETSKKLIKEILQKGIEEGWGIDKIAREIKRVSAVENSTRAKTIARTEVGRVANVGKILAAKRMEVAMDKTWSAARDERTRKSHHLAHGQTVDLDDAFTVGGVRMIAPGDPSAPAKETVNCRCSMTFKIKLDPQGQPIPRSYYTPTTQPLRPRNLVGEIAEAISTGVSLGIILRQAIQDEQTIQGR
jgi:SPP1 gp7 family putative phage head morphogenesis protein